MYEDLKRRVWEANLLLPKYGLVTFTWGNVSGIDRENGVVAIKPSGVEYDKLRPEHIVLVDMEGKPLADGLKPSSDLATHLELYHSFEGIGGVTHTHSRWATAWAQAGADLPAMGTTHADYFYGPVPCTREMTEEEISCEYEKNTGKVIVETFRALDPQSVPAVLVMSHGPFTWGAGPEKSVENSVVLEEVALMAFAARNIDPVKKNMQGALLDKHFCRKHGENAYYGQ